MIDWLKILKWMLQPKNALIVILALAVAGLAISLWWESSARARAETVKAALSVELAGYAAQNAALKTNIEEIKKLKAKTQVIERNTHEIREIVNQVPVEVPVGGGPCENPQAKEEIARAAGAIVDYFNRGRVPETDGDSRSPVLPPPGEAGPE